MILVTLWLRRWGIKDEICCRQIRGEAKILKNIMEEWQYVYNVKRPHFGEGINGKTCVEKLSKILLNEKFAMFPRYYIR